MKVEAFCKTPVKRYRMWVERSWLVVVISGGDRGGAVIGGDCGCSGLGLMGFEVTKTVEHVEICGRGRQHEQRCGGGQDL